MAEKNKNRGFVFTLEAIMAALLFCLVILSLQIGGGSSTKELIALQKADDLLVIWSINYPTTLEMKKDIDFVLNGKAAIFVDEELAVGSTRSVEAVSVSGVIFDELLNEHKIRIIVYFSE